MTMTDIEDKLPPQADEDPAAEAVPAEDDYSYPLSYYSESREEKEEYRRKKERAEQLRHYDGYVPPQPPSGGGFRALPEDEGLSLRALTEAAMMIAVSLVLAVISLYVPVLSVIGSLLYPVPIAVLVLRRGLKVGLTGTAALLLLSCIFFGWMKALLMLVEYGAVGLFLGYSFRRKMPPVGTLAVTSVIAACGTMIDLMLSLFVSGLPVSQLADEFSKYVNEYLAMLEQSGLAESILPAGMTLQQYGDMMIAQMEKVIPGALILSSMLLTVILYLISTRVLRRLRYDIPVLPAFALWRMDWRWVWGVVTGLLCQLLGHQLEIDWLGTLGLNALYVFGPILGLCGLALVIWMMKNMRLGVAFKLLIVFVLIRMASLMIILLMLLGVVDSVVDIRSAYAGRREQSGQ